MPSRQTNDAVAACERSIFSKNHDHNKLFEALKLMRVIYTVLMQNRSCFTRKQTCNGEYTKHCTRSRHQLKMAAPAEVSEKRSNIRSNKTILRKTPF